jgi:hypothetical protein
MEGFALTMVVAELTRVVAAQQQRIEDLEVKPRAGSTAKK